MRSERTFPSTTQSIVRARRFAAELLVGVDRDVADSIVVMVSELVTNSVRHAASEFTLSLERDHQSMRVAVTDTGEQQPSLRNPAPTEQSGRGLQIVDALSDDWGVIETAGRGGKTVWFVVALDPPERGAEDGASAKARAVVRRADGAGGDSPRIARPTRSKAAAPRPRPEGATQHRDLCRV
jgi:anti-sigma regulatory factor (Ser/Thr protein kinase)